MAERRIAFFMNSLQRGGAERVILTLAHGLVERGGYAVDVVLGEKAGPLLSDIPQGARIVELGLAPAPAVCAALARLPWATFRRLTPLLFPYRPPKAVRSVPRFAAYLRRERPAGLLTTLSFNNLAALWAAALAGGPTRIVVREAITLSQDLAQANVRERRLLPWLVAAWYPRAAGIVAVSDGVAADLARLDGLSRERITTIYNPIDLARIGALAEESPEDPWLIAGAPPVITAVGRLYVQKDYATLLRAFARVAAASPARLLILGEGPERPKLEALVRELGIAERVRLPGAVGNPFAFLRRSALFVLSSVYEGFPNVMMEALACGCPVVGTDCPSGPAELLDGGRWGRLVPVGDDRRLAEAILASLQEPRRADRAQSRAAQFSVRESLDRYLRLLLGPTT